MALGTMACCHVHTLRQTRATYISQTLAAPDCKPIFVPLAAPPAVLTAQAPHGTDDGFTAASALIAATGGIVSRRITIAMRQRPPPAADFPTSDLRLVPGLRAPPPA